MIEGDSVFFRYIPNSFRKKIGMPDREQKKIGMPIPVFKKVRYDFEEKLKEIGLNSCKTSKFSRLRRAKHRKE